jgi:hypothetical protein
VRHLRHQNWDADPAGAIGGAALVPGMRCVGRGGACKSVSCVQSDLVRGVSLLSPH